MGRTSHSIYDCSNVYFSKCVQDYVLAGLAFPTLVFCVVLARRFYLNGRNFFGHRLVVLYLNIAELLFGMAHWLYFGATWLDFAILTLKIWSFLVIALFFSRNALRMLHKENLISQYLYPLLSFLFCVVTILFIVTVAGVIPNSYDCESLTWLMLAISEFVVVSCVSGACYFLLRQMDEIRMSDSVRVDKRRRLWLLIFVYAVTSALNVFYEIIISLTVSNQSQCEEWFWN